MSKHTEGPWKKDDWDIMGGDNSRIATVIPWDYSGCRDEDEANARLIAAAPDLLAACKAFQYAMEHYGHIDKTDRLIANAIKKAELVK